MFRIIGLQILAVIFFIQSAAAADLVINVHGVTARSKGRIIVDLWRSGEIAATFPKFDTVAQNTNGEKGEKACNWKSKNFAICRQASAVNASRLSLTFTNVPAGDYALAIFHDANEDWQFNRVVSVPTEGGGFSNVPPTQLKRGYEPAFEKSKFKVPDQREITVNVRYP